MLIVLCVEDFWMFLKRNLKLKRRVLPSREHRQSPDRVILIAVFNHFAVKTYALSYWFFQNKTLFGGTALEIVQLLERTSTET